MKYEYLYQTRKNENRRGEIDARNRAEAYLLLRKQGIRPYRVIGDDPVRWQPWALGALATIIAAAVSVAIALAVAGRGGRDGGQPSNRHQIKGQQTIYVC